MIVDSFHYGFTIADCGCIPFVIARSNATKQSRGTYIAQQTFPWIAAVGYRLLRNDNRVSAMRVSTNIQIT